MSLATLAQKQEPSISRNARADPPPNGFEMLTRYIPTETITLYVGAMAARDEIASATGLGVWGIYWVFALLTPTLLALLLRRQEPPKPVTWWPLFASCVAFLVWAMSVPGHPVADEWKALPAFAALLVSTLLSLLEPRPKPAA